MKSSIIRKRTFLFERLDIVFFLLIIISLFKILLYFRELFFLYNLTTYDYIYLKSSNILTLPIIRKIS